jgi:hypothetical protein
MDRSFLLSMAMLCAASASVCAEERARPNNLFTASGFTVKYADTPEKLALLHTFPADKLAIRRKGGKTYYVYADPKGCGCAYVGTPEAWAVYQNGGTTTPFDPTGGSPPAYVRDVEDSIAEDGSIDMPGSLLGNFLDQE